MQVHELVQWIFNVGILLLGGLASFILNKLCSALEKVQKLEVSLASSVAATIATQTEKDKMDTMVRDELTKINTKLDSAPCRIPANLRPN